jgi:hypothetical protein
MAQFTVENHINSTKILQNFLKNSVQLWVFQAQLHGWQGAVRSNYF